ncbi:MULTISPECIES: alkaline phosphatase D family protein [Streptomyces]|uniref:Alkaline phosphatase D family protein n=2 Tax=Streptomyces TaxID=1883 RepID=A0ABS9JEK0_9ACTN|nr:MULTISPECIES: alkaline phosphatase D family protein [Streptomyces]MCG0064003.1 alkaline phosphatase D family protein [Streptomyces tricolor]OYP17630.1 alkaline phosphatase [Streptomyces sp. FBKL.4005]BCM66891.1 putative alkaline phosphatase, secreted [Streptomyces sp. EAS-AB2608]CUW28462.1 Alkaline phosphatase D precursor [Streptomyces reticuli]
MTAPSPDRRRFLTAGAAVLGAAASAQLWLPGTARAADTPLPDGVFTLGVASGDPLPDGIVLWTRLAPDPLNGGGMPDAVFPVAWEIAEDERFRRVARRGTAEARPELGHSVHVDVRGLRPDRPYWYRFRAGDQLSPTGRTRTAPHPRRRGGSLRVALASCQNWQHGYFTPYADMLAQDPDVVLFVGDYIYESGPSATAVRRHEGKGEPYTLVQYRNRYAQYRTDPDLAAMHASAPWVVTFDDHEVDNDWAAEIPQDPDKQPHDKFTARMTAAFQAYYEHMPVRASAIPTGPHIQMYRRLEFGRLARLNVLDTRQYRSDQATSQEGAEAPSRTMLGAEQKQWLLDGLYDSPARWNLIASQIMMAETDLLPGDGKLWYYDAWDGYQVERNALLEEFAEIRNPVVLSGDRHLTMISDLRTDYADPDSDVVGAEFVGTSISSSGDQDQDAFHKQWDPLMADNPHWKFIDAHRGYHLFDIRRDGIDARVRAVDTVLKPQASARTLVTLRVESDEPGVRIV